MLRAITRDVSPTIESCELSFLDRESIDYSVAVQQLNGYRAALRNCGVEVIELSAEPDYPDACFVEDTAIVVDELAIICNPGASTRRGETRAIKLELSKHRELAEVVGPATIDGGDVLRVGMDILIGLSQRTNLEGFKEVTRILGPLGYRVRPVTVTGCLHFKSACTAIDDETLLVNRNWIDLEGVAGFRTVFVPEQEPWSANLLRVDKRVFIQPGFPRTEELVRKVSDHVETLDVSEFRKAEGSLTCLSLLFWEQS